MSFEDMTKKDLLVVAEMFGVEVKPVQTKAEILTAIGDNYVNYDDYVRMSGIVEEEKELVEATKPEVVDDDATVLVKFVGKNASYETHGHVYTQRHPFHLVHPDTASYLVGSKEPELQGKFAIATPDDAKNFYS